MKIFLGLIGLVITAVTALPPNQHMSSECRQVEKDEKCSKIMADAFSNDAWRKGLRSGFQHYCSKIPAFVPCLEEDQAVYRLLTECQMESMSEVMLGIQRMMSWDDMWSLSIDFLNTANDIVCSRTDEIVKLWECVGSKEAQFPPILSSCVGQHIATLGATVEQTSGAIDPEILCSPLLGFASCMKTGLSGMCGAEVSDLLDTVYNDLVDGVIGEALGCQETNTILEFVRSVRDKYRK